MQSEQPPNKRDCVCIDDPIFVFPDRKDPDYINYLKNEIIRKLKDVQYLKDNAIDYSDEKRKKFRNITELKGRENVWKKYKYIRIFFCGMSCRTLLGDDDNGVDRDSIDYIFTDFLNDTEFIRELNEKYYIRLKIRFLFPYIYSDFVYSMTEGQLTSHAMDVSELPKYNFEVVNKPSINEKMLYAVSRIAKAQSISFDKIYSILNKRNSPFEITSHDSAMNSIQIRYTAAPLHLCSLIINNIALCDPYLFAKEAPGRNRFLAHKFPVVKLEKKQNDEHFEYIRKHFSTLWTCDTSIFCSDALIHFDEKNKRLKERTETVIFKPPSEIDWKHKQIRIEERMKDRDLPDATEDEIIAWKKYMTDNLMKHTGKYPELLKKYPEFIKQADVAKKTRSLTLLNGDQVVLPGHLNEEINIKDSFFQISYYDNRLSLLFYLKDKNILIKYEITSNEKATAPILAMYHIARSTRDKEVYPFNYQIDFYNGVGHIIKICDEKLKNTLKGGPVFKSKTFIMGNSIPVSPENIVIDPDLNNNKEFRERVWKLINRKTLNHEMNSMERQKFDSALEKEFSNSLS